MKVSVSMLSTYLFCPRKFFLQQVLGLREAPKESTVLGGIRHEVYDKANRDEEKLVSSIKELKSYSHVAELYTSNYLKHLREAVIRNKPGMRNLSITPLSAFKITWPHVKEEAVGRAGNTYTFMKNDNLFGRELWNKLTPKIISEMGVSSESLGLKGVVDRLEVHEDKYVPVELKTGKAPKEGVWPAHRVQISAYSLLLEEKFRKRIGRAAVNYLDSKESREVTINPFMKEEIKSLTNEVFRIMNSKTLPDYCYNKNKCINCGLRKTCYSGEEIESLISNVA